MREIPRGALRPAARNPRGGVAVVGAKRHGRGAFAPTGHARGPRLYWVKTTFGLRRQRGRWRARASARLATAEIIC